MMWLYKLIKEKPQIVTGDRDSIFYGTKKQISPEEK